MSRHFVADLPIEAQANGIVQLLMEVMEDDDEDQGVFLYHLLADGNTNGSDFWFLDRVTLMEAAFELYGVDADDWRDFTGPIPDYGGPFPT